MTQTKERHPDSFILPTEEELDPLEQLSLMNLSYSRFNTFETCEAQYFYTYIAKEDRTFGPKATLGTVVHEVLEHSVGEGPLDLGEMHRLEREAHKEYDPDNVITGDLVMLGSEILYEFHTRHKEDEEFVSDDRVIAREKGFELIIGSARVRGYIDLVRKTEDGLIGAVDWKAQPLDAPILTPDGWRRMGDLQVGDTVIDGQGQQTKIQGVHPQGVVPAYRVHFKDGTSTVTAGDHLWTIDHAKKGTIEMTTDELRKADLTGENYSRSHNTHNFRVPTVEPVEMNKKHLEIDPYIMGVILGDGGITTDTLKITSVDQPIFDEVERRLPDGLFLRDDWNITKRISSNHGSPKGRNDGAYNPYIRALKSYGLMGCKSAEKFIPRDYLESDVQDRLDLLRGLMDTDGGTVTRVDFRTSSPQLAEDVKELVRSLGGVPTMSTYQPKGKSTYHPSYIVNLCFDNFNPFLLPRKAESWKQPVYKPKRPIIKVERVLDQEMQCITVESDTAQYVTEHHIVTHNSGSWEVSDKDIPGNLQLGIYALAIAQENPHQEVFPAELYYLQSGKRKEHVFTWDDLRDVRDRVIELTNEIIDSSPKGFKCTDKGFVCKYLCDYGKTGVCGKGAYIVNNWGK